MCGRRAQTNARAGVCSRKAQSKVPGIKCGNGSLPFPFHPLFSPPLSSALLFIVADDVARLKLILFLFSPFPSLPCIHPVSTRPCTPHFAKIIRNC